MTNSTDSLYYQILNAILGFNANLHFPKLADVLSKVSYNSLSVRVAINHMKSQGYIKTKDIAQHYSYYITPQGIDYIHLIEINEQKDKILAHYNRMFPILGD